MPLPRYELGIESAIDKRLQRGGKNGPAAVEALIRDWMRLFNLDRGQSVQTAQDTTGKGGAAATSAVAAAAQAAPSADELEAKKRDREHKPTRKPAMKFEDLRMDEQSSKKMAEASNNQGEKATAQTFKLTSQEVYEVFKHGSHYLREAVKPEVQRTELNRIELSMPKKLVDTVMMLVNANLKMLLGDRARGFGLTMLRHVAVSNQLAGRREFSAVHVAQALLMDQVNTEGLTLWLHLNKEEGGCRSRRRSRRRPSSRPRSTSSSTSPSRRASSRSTCSSSLPTAGTAGRRTRRPPPSSTTPS